MDKADGENPAGDAAPPARLGRDLRGHTDALAALVEHRNLVEFTEGHWILAEAVDGRIYNYRPEEFLPQEHRWRVMSRITAPMVAATLLAAVALGGASGEDAVQATLVLLIGGALGLGFCALQYTATQKVRAKRARTGIPAGRKPLPVPPETSAERHRRHQSDHIEETPVIDDATTGPGEKRSGTRPDQEWIVRDSPGAEPTNEELANREWPLLPSASEEDEPEQSWWERHQGWEKYRRQHELGHDDLNSAVAENRRLTASSDHRWILARDSAQRWYNYRPEEYRWAEGWSRRGFAISLGAGLMTLLTVTGVMGLISSPSTETAIATAVVGLLTTGFWVPIGIQIRAGRARAKRGVPPPRSAAYPVAADPTDEDRRNHRS